MQRTAWVYLLSLAVITISLGFAACGGEQAQTQEGSTPSETAATVRVDSAYGADSVPIYYELRGQGDTALVLVHGWGINGSFWEHQTEVFDDSFTVVSLDMAGHGRSGSQREAWTVASYASDLVAVLEDAGIENAILIGHSMGGMVIADAATMASEHVVALIGVDNLRDFKYRGDQQQAEQFVAPFRQNYDSAAAWFAGEMLPEGVEPAVRERIVSEFQAGDPEIRIETLRNIFTYDLAATMQEVHAPVRAIVSDANSVNIDGNRTIVPSFDMKVISGVGHFPFLERPSAFNQELRAMLADLRGAQVVH